MPYYETAVVLDPQLEEEAITQKLQQYVELLTQNGAQEVQLNRRGMTKLAYPIKGKDGGKRTQADYTFIAYQAPPTIVATVETRLRLDEDVLRYMTVRYDRMPPAQSVSMDESKLEDREEEARTEAEAQTGGVSDESAPEEETQRTEDEEEAEEEQSESEE